MQRSLTPKQIAVLSALMSGATNEEAARMAGVSGATVERYKADPLFRENMIKLASETLQLVSEKLIATSVIAMDKLTEMIASDDTRGSDRLKAIEIVFKNLETFGGLVRHQQRKDEEEIRDERTKQMRERRRRDDDTPGTSSNRS